jgi:hypothetical protein
MGNVDVKFVVKDLDFVPAKRITTTHLCGFHTTKSSNFMRRKSVDVCKSKNKYVGVGGGWGDFGSGVQIRI